MRRAAKVGPLFVVVATYLLGWSSLLAIWAFVFVGPFRVLDLSMGRYTALAWDALLSVIFFVQHSGMVRRPFRRWLTKLAPSPYHGAVYSMTSGVALLIVVVLWQDAGYTVATAQGVVRYALRGVFLLSMAGMMWGIVALRSFDTLGLNPLRDHLRGTRTPGAPFTIRGPYRWVRHPLYLFCITAIWACPDLTLDRLLFNVLWSVWIVAGTV